MFHFVIILQEPANRLCAHTCTRVHAHARVCRTSAAEQRGVFVNVRPFVATGDDTTPPQDKQMQRDADIPEHFARRSVSHTHTQTHTWNQSGVVQKLFATGVPLLKVQSVPAISPPTGLLLKRCEHARKEKKQSVFFL